MTKDEAAILSSAASGKTIVQSLVGDRLWSLLEDPFTVFDDMSPRRLRSSRFIELSRPGSRMEDRADEYRLTTTGRAALAAYRLRHPREEWE